MTTETSDLAHNEKRKKKVKYVTNSGDVVYCLGMIGAAIFYIGQATTFWIGVLGFLKALVWPVFLVLEALKALT